MNFKALLLAIRPRGLELLRAAYYGSRLAVRLVRNIAAIQQCNLLPRTDLIWHCSVSNLIRKYTN